VYIEQLRKPAYWAGEPEIRAMARHLSVGFRIWTPESMFGDVGPSIIEGHSCRIVDVWFSGRNHYDCLYRLSDRSSCAICQSIVMDLMQNSFSQAFGGDFCSETPSDTSTGVPEGLPDYDFYRNIEYELWSHERHTQLANDAALAQSINLQDQLRSVRGHSNKQKHKNKQKFEDEQQQQQPPPPPPQQQPPPPLPLQQPQKQPQLQQIDDERIALTPIADSAVEQEKREQFELQRRPQSKSQQSKATKVSRQDKIVLANQKNSEKQAAQKVEALARKQAEATARSLALPISEESVKVETSKLELEADPEPELELDPQKTKEERRKAKQAAKKARAKARKAEEASKKLTEAKDSGECSGPDSRAELDAPDRDSNLLTKEPQTSMQHLELSDKIESYDARIAAANTAEDFEECARLRDERDALRLQRGTNAVEETVLSDAADAPDSPPQGETKSQRGKRKKKERAEKRASVRSDIAEAEASGEHSAALELLQSHPTDLPAAEAAMTILAKYVSFKISGELKATPKQLNRSIDMLNQLINAMTQHLTSEKVQHYGCIAVGNIFDSISDDSENLNKLLQPMDISALLCSAGYALLMALTEHPSVDMRKAAVGAFNKVMGNGNKTRLAIMQKHEPNILRFFCHAEHGRILEVLDENNQTSEISEEAAARMQKNKKKKQRQKQRKKESAAVAKVTFERASADLNITNDGSAVSMPVPKLHRRDKDKNRTAVGSLIPHDVRTYVEVLINDKPKEGKILLGVGPHDVLPEDLKGHPASNIQGWIGFDLSTGYLHFTDEHYFDIMQPNAWEAPTAGDLVALCVDYHLPTLTLFKNGDRVASIRIIGKGTARTPRDDLAPFGFGLSGPGSLQDEARRCVTEDIKFVDNLCWFVTLSSYGDMVSINGAPVPRPEERWVERSAKTLDRILIMHFSTENHLPKELAQHLIDNKDKPSIACTPDGQRVPMVALTRLSPSALQVMYGCIGAFLLAKGIDSSDQQAFEPSGQELEVLMKEFTESPTRQYWERELLKKGTHTEAEAVRQISQFLHEYVHVLVCAVALAEKGLALAYPPTSEVIDNPLYVEPVRAHQLQAPKVENPGLDQDTLELEEGALGRSVPLPHDRSPMSGSGCSLNCELQTTCNGELTMRESTEEDLDAALDGDLEDDLDDLRRQEGHDMFLAFWEGHCWPETVDAEFVLRLRKDAAARVRLDSLNLPKEQQVHLYSSKLGELKYMLRQRGHYGLDDAYWHKCKYLWCLNIECLLQLEVIQDTENFGWLHVTSRRMQISEDIRESHEIDVAVGDLQQQRTFLAFWKGCHYFPKAVGQNRVLEFENCARSMIQQAIAAGNTNEQLIDIFSTHLDEFSRLHDQHSFSEEPPDDHTKDRWYIVIESLLQLGAIQNDEMYGWQHVALNEKQSMEKIQPTFWPVNVQQFS
jgi:hypothetical protein